MAAVDVAAQHLELAGAEQRLSLRALRIGKLARRAIHSARHCDWKRARSASGSRCQIRSTAALVAAATASPWARALFGTADLVVQRGPRVAIDAQDVLGVDRAAQRPHLAAQRRGDLFQRQRAAVRVRQRLRAIAAQFGQARRRPVMRTAHEGSRPLRDTQMSGPRCPACCSATTASTALRLVPITQTVASAAMPAASSLTG